MSAPQILDESFIEFFDDAPVLDMEIPAFDEALGRAVADQHDALAFSALTTHMEQARSAGNLDRLYEMAMTIGAMACMHEHMQAFSSNFNIAFMGVDELLHVHDGLENHDDEYEIDPQTGKKIKKKKRPHH